MIDDNHPVNRFLSYARRKPNAPPVQLVQEAMQIMLAEQQRQFDALKWRLDYDPAKEPL